MCHLPTDIAGDENIVRAILCPAHVKLGSAEIKHQAFRSRPGIDEVSVIRHSKQKNMFVGLSGSECTPRRIYWRMWVYSSRLS